MRKSGPHPVVQVLSAPSAMAPQPVGVFVTAALVGVRVAVEVRVGVRVGVTVRVLVGSGVGVTVGVANAVPTMFNTKSVNSDGSLTIMLLESTNCVSRVIGSGGANCQ